MREIKFRAWVNSYSHWHMTKKVTIGSNGVFFHAGESNITNPNWKLIQYTGLKDKNGTEIYEGDVYVHNVQDYVAGHPREINFIKPVTFEMGAFWVGDMLLVDAIENDSESKVIGNIYENPELLEEGEK